MTTTLCLIPARGGSKGVPRKNLREVGGKPLIAWTIEQALAAQAPLDVVVSTEDAEIAEVAVSFGARVIERPIHLAQDTTATEPVVLHAIEDCTTTGRRPDEVMLLQATSPTRRPGTIDRALTQFRDSGADSMVGVVPQAPFLWWSGHPPRADYDIDRRLRRQDMTADQLRYRETGSLYVTRTELYEAQHNRLGGRIELFVMSESEGIDIDTALDFELAGRYLQ